MNKSREAFERNECKKYGCNYDDMKKNWDWFEAQYGWRYPPDSPRGLKWAVWDEAWQEQQKRIDAALKETQHALQYVESDMRGNHEFLKMAMIRTFKSLAQTLKGGEV